MVDKSPIERVFHLRRRINWTRKQAVLFFYLKSKFLSLSASSSCWKVDIDRTHTHSSTMAGLDLVYDVTMQINSREPSVGESTVHWHPCIQVGGANSIAEVHKPWLRVLFNASLQKHVYALWYRHRHLRKLEEVGTLEHFNITVHTYMYSKIASLQH